MAENTNAQIILWDNTRVRPLCDEIVHLIAAITQYMNDYTAQGIAALINANTPSNIIADGSDTDGRVQITGTQIINLEAALSQINTALTVTTVSGVGSTVQTIVDAMHVN